MVDKSKRKLSAIFKENIPMILEMKNAGYTYEHIADKLGFNEVTFKSYIKRFRQLLIDSDSKDNFSHEKNIYHAGAELETPHHGNEEVSKDVSFEELMDEKKRTKSVMNYMVRSKK
ncbi:helix-turn-helix domain-containing protein [Dickeya dadantii]|uniref:helix-turn-helix domain-containing protein n=1 Tax=Dickeya dadantii TaxID=204038 RepID=UPI001495B2EC|nr:helix-turn-helix domain-containing protein [Dickeya dadantii]NPE55881.1 helix-turn-helix domain-containing protein [Dickeya dadantii]NPE67653.1 helix-turn-helix domain-containing protein [Dickeya dadantii]